MSLPRSCCGDAIGIRLLTDVGDGDWVCVVIALGVCESALYRSAISAFLRCDFSLSDSWVLGIPLSLSLSLSLSLRHFTFFSSRPIGDKYRLIWLPYCWNDTRMYAFSSKRGHLAHCMIGLMIFGFTLSEGANSLYFILCDVPNGGRS